MTTEAMRAVRCHSPQDYRLETIPVPEPGPGELLLRIEAVGICASDVKCYQGAPLFWGDEHSDGYCQAPVTAGHEFVGTVLVADELAQQRWRVAEGDRVVSEQIVPCWTCRFCQRGTYWMCKQHDIYGFRTRTQGGMADYLLVPAQARVHRISSHLPAAHAAFTEPLSCALHAVERASISFGDVVVVAGGGPIGLGMIAGARRRGPRTLVAVDLDDSRLEVASDCGADITINATTTDVLEAVADLTDGYGCDVYLNATGHPDGVIQGLRALRKLGTFVEYGVFGHPTTVDWTIIGDSKELDIKGAHLGAYCWPTAIQLLEEEQLPMERIVTHQLPMDRFLDGIDLVADGHRSIKVALVP